MTFEDHHHHLHLLLLVVGLVLCRFRPSLPSPVKTDNKQTNERKFSCHERGTKKQLDKQIFHILIVTDADNDEVRCRWASGSSECGDICGGYGLPNAWMHIVCTNTVSSILTDTSFKRVTGVGPCAAVFSHFTMS